LSPSSRPPSSARQVRSPEPFLLSLSYQSFQVPELDISKAQKFEKTKFSMITPEVERALGNAESAVLFGIEVRLDVFLLPLRDVDGS